MLTPSRFSGKAAVVETQKNIVCTTADKPIPVSGAPQLLQVLQHLAHRGASVDVIRLAMVRGGISEDVARLLAPCVVSTRKMPASPPAPEPAVLPIVPAPTAADTGRAAEAALRAMMRGVMLIAVVWVFGIALGFVVGMELGVAQGIEDGLDRLRAAAGF